jgi:hypothetical protein
MKSIKERKLLQKIVGALVDQQEEGEVDEQDDTVDE